MVVNKFGQDITGYPFDKSQSFASEERRALATMMGRTYGVVTGLGDKMCQVSGGPLVATIQPGTIFINGAFVTIKEPVTINVDSNTVGWIVAQMDLSQDNSATGIPDDGTYEYMLNQVQFKAIKDEPQYDLTGKALRYDVPLAKYTMSGSLVQITDYRTYANRPAPRERENYGMFMANWPNFTHPGNQASTDMKTVNFDTNRHRSIDILAAQGLVVRQSTTKDGVFYIDNNTDRSVVVDVTIKAAVTKAGNDGNNKFIFETHGIGHSQTEPDMNYATVVTKITTINTVFYLSGLGMARNTIYAPHAYSIAPRSKLALCGKFAMAGGFDANKKWSVSELNAWFDFYDSQRLDGQP